MAVIGGHPSEVAKRQKEASFQHQAHQQHQEQQKEVHEDKGGGVWNVLFPDEDQYASPIKVVKAACFARSASVIERGGQDGASDNSGIVTSHILSPCPKRAKAQSLGGELNRKEATDSARIGGEKSVQLKPVKVEDNNEVAPTARNLDTPQSFKGEDNWQESS